MHHMSIPNHKRLAGHQQFTGGHLARILGSTCSSCDIWLAVVCDGKDWKEYNNFSFVVQKHYEVVSRNLNQR